MRRPARGMEGVVGRLSITHVSGHAVAELDVGQPRHAAPQDGVARRRVSLAIQVAADPRRTGAIRLRREPAQRLSLLRLQTKCCLSPSILVAGIAHR